MELKEQISWALHSIIDAHASNRSPLFYNDKTYLLVHFSRHGKPGAFHIFDEEGNGNIFIVDNYLYKGLIDENKIVSDMINFIKECK